MELFEILEGCDFFILDWYLFFLCDFFILDWYLFFFFFYISSGFNGTRLRSIKLCFMVYIML
jgi:hypothetical protein